MAGSPFDVKIRVIAGTLVELSGHDSSSTVLDLKRCLQRQLGISRFCLQLVLDHHIVEDDVVVGELSQPVVLSLVKLPLNQELELFNSLKAAACSSSTEVEALLHQQASLDRDECRVTFIATPLQVAATDGNVDVIRLLCEAGAEKDHYGLGFTALGLAAQYGHVAVCRALYECGADKDGQCSQGNNPLSIAAKNGRLEVLRYLCGIGADLENRSGLVPLQAALSGRHYRAAHALREAGAHPLHIGSAAALLAEAMRREWLLLVMPLTTIAVLALGLCFTLERVAISVALGLAALQLLHWDPIGSTIILQYVALLCCSAIVCASYYNAQEIGIALLSLACGKFVLSPCIQFMGAVMLHCTPFAACMCNMFYCTEMSVLVASM